VLYYDWLLLRQQRIEHKMKKELTISITSTALFLGFNGIASADQIHTVKEDAHLSDIAQIFATTTNEIQSLNHIDHRLAVQAGEELVVPESDIVEVKEGDTLLSIAEKHQLKLNDLYQLNPNLESIIYPGQFVAVSEKGSAHLNHQLQKILKEHNQIQNSSTINFESASPTEPSKNINNEIPLTSNQSMPTIQNWQPREDNKLYETKQPVSKTYRPVQVASNGSNYYDWGQCTYYAFERRQQLGKSVGNLWGNANNWATSASSNGYRVDHTPEVGAIFQTNAGNYGHVGIVERKNSDGSIVVSEMNWQGVGKKSYRTIHNAGQYRYIH